jgi:hypothetical protein
MAHQEPHQPHDHDDDESYGMALGFRIFEDQGQLFLAEVEVTPYVDEPNALGATLVFHPLEGIDPTAGNEDLDWPAWPIDIDDDLTRSPGESLSAQFQGILRQLSGLSEQQLKSYLGIAREEAESAEDEE